IQNRPAQERITGHISAHEARDLAASSSSHRSQVACKDFAEDRRLFDYPNAFRTAHAMRVAMRQNDDVSRFERKLGSIRHADYSGTLDHEVVNHKMKRPRCQRWGQIP